MNQKNMTIVLVLLATIAIVEVWFIWNQQQQIDQLEFRIMSLQYQNTVLSTRSSLLESNMSDILDEFEKQVREIKREKSELEQGYSIINDENERLEYSLGNLQNEYEEIFNELNNYIDQFSKIRREINSRVGLDGNLSRFVTYRDPAVVGWMLEITNGWSNPESMDELYLDYESMYSWVETVISKELDSPYPFIYADSTKQIGWVKHSVRYPNETISDFAGDCEDQAILLLSMIKAYNYQSEAWCITIDWEGGGHVGVAYPTGDGLLVILDPSQDYKSEFTSIGEPIVVAVEDWINTFNYDDVIVNSIYNDEIFLDFEDTSDFIDWFNENYS
jgi:hypothetical protein